MTIVTRLTLTSGDRAALEGAVDDVRETARRKGAELRGPHSDAPETFRVPLYERLDGDPARTLDPWTYTVHARRIEILGHEEIANRLLDRGFPDSVRVEVELDRIRGAGRS